MTDGAVSSAGQQGISGAKVKNQPFALPPLEEQHEIVRRVDALFKLADAIEKRVAAATIRAERLTQAVLAKAFRGELVPTEAELARRESREYEPAAVLLKRIKAERAGVVNEKKARKEKNAMKNRRAR
jgi:type I restriction enzyme S subunit